MRGTYDVTRIVQFLPTSKLNNKVQSEIGRRCRCVRRRMLYFMPIMKIFFFAQHRPAVKHMNANERRESMQNSRWMWNTEIHFFFLFLLLFFWILSYVERGKMLRWNVSVFFSICGGQLIGLLFTYWKFIIHQHQTIRLLTSFLFVCLFFNFYSLDTVTHSVRCARCTLLE